MPSHKKARRALSEAFEDQVMVDIERTPMEADDSTGYIVALGSKWAMLSRITDGGYFDGYLAFRVAEAERVSRNLSFAPLFAQSLPEWPPHPLGPGLNLDDTAGLLEGLAALSPLIAIEKEHKKRAMWIGELDHIDGNRFWLNEVRPDASWLINLNDHKLAAVTAVTIGGRYLTALAQVSGAPRAKSSDSTEDSAPRLDP